MIDEDITKLAIKINENKCTVSELIELSKHDNVYIRSLVASNSKTPINIIKILAKDDDVLVKASAIDNIKYPKKPIKEFSNDNISQKPFSVNLDTLLK